ncbi:cytochrome C biogenesis protein CycH, partial [Nesterenkonia salmonea]
KSVPIEETAARITRGPTPGGNPTVWLTQQQIAELFNTTQQNISMHVQHIVDEGELPAEATHKDFLLVRREGAREVSRRVTHYNLDMILSVGYRVKSGTATRFRIWATERLTDYVVKGAAINERRLKELGSVVKILERSADSVVQGLAHIVTQYLPSLQLLQQYDDGALLAPEGSVPKWQLTYHEARQIIDELAVQFPQNTLFGHERNDGLKGVVEAIYQGFAGQDLYPTAEAKAANLLYLIIKDQAAVH